MSLSNKKKKASKSDAYPFSEGDLIEYTRDFLKDRTKFGLVISVKKIIGAYQLEVLWGNRTGFVDSRLVENRCK